MLQIVQRLNKDAKSVRWRCDQALYVAGTEALAAQNNKLRATDWGPMGEQQEEQQEEQQGRGYLRFQSAFMSTRVLADLADFCLDC